MSRKKGYFISSQSPKNGNSFKSSYEIDIPKQLTGSYEISFYMYMFCKSKCENSNDYLNVLIQNENNEIVANELYLYSSSDYTIKEWIQKNITFSNSAKNVKVNFRLIYVNKKRFYSKNII